MNRIEMYASSAHLKQGLHRVLAVAHSPVHSASPVSVSSTPVPAAVARETGASSHCRNTA